MLAALINEFKVKGRTDGRTDGRTKGNPISPFRNFVATGDKNDNMGAKTVPRGAKCAPDFHFPPFCTH